MAPTDEAKKVPHKLKRLPQSHRITKRPPIRPAVPSPYTSSSSPKVIYISSKIVFSSVVKRVRKLLGLIDKRAAGKKGSNDDKASNQKRPIGNATDGNGRSNHKKEEVLLKGTGKAVENVLALGLFFMRQDDVKVRVGTGTVSVVDDIVETEQAEGAQVAEQESESEVPETQIRKTSMIEVGISLK